MIDDVTRSQNRTEDDPKMTYFRALACNYSDGREKTLDTAPDIRKTYRTRRHYDSYHMIHKL